MDSNYSVKDSFSLNPVVFNNTEETIDALIGVINILISTGHQVFGENFEDDLQFGYALLLTWVLKALEYEKARLAVLSSPLEEDDQDG